MTPRTKGLLVALATVAIVGIQLSTLTPSWAGYVVYLALLAIPCGIYGGALAARVREDRFLIIAAYTLAIPGVLGFITLLAHHEPHTDVAASLLGRAAVPLLIAAAALERWTRVAELPIARPQRGWRRLTTIELAALLTTLTSAAVALLIVLTDRPALDEWSRWHHRTAAVDITRVHEVFVFVAATSLPIGVLLGVVAQRLQAGRRVALGAIALLGAMWVGCSLDMFTPLDFERHYLVPVVVLVLVLERATRPRIAARLGGATIGLLIGAANGLSISIALFAIIFGHGTRWTMEALVVPCVILAFALPAGAIFGGIATRMHHHRSLMLHLLAFGAVTMIAAGFEIPVTREPTALVFYLWSVVSTAIGVCVLERATRPRLET